MSKRKADDMSSPTEPPNHPLPRTPSPPIKHETTPRRIESFILRPRITQLQTLGPLSHFAYAQLANVLQALIDKNGPPGPLLDEVASAFNKAHEVIEFDIKIWISFTKFVEVTPIHKAGLDYIHKWLPVTVARLMGIEIPGASDMNWMFHFVGAMEAKDAFVCGNVVQIQKAAAYMDGAVAARAMVAEARSGESKGSSLDAMLTGMSNGIRRGILEIETCLYATAKFHQIVAEFEPYRLAAMDAEE